MALRLQFHASSVARRLGIFRLDILLRFWCDVFFSSEKHVYFCQNSPVPMLINMIMST